MLLFSLIFGISGIFLFVIVIIQFIIKLYRGKELGTLAKIGNDLGNYFCAIASFLTYHTERMPYPFNEWSLPKRNKNRSRNLKKNT